MGNRARPTLKCFQDLMSRWKTKGSRPLRSDYELIADFCGVRHHALVSWRSGRNKPVGTSLIKIRHLLDAAGYKVREQEAVKCTSKLCHELGALVAHNLVSVDELTDELQYNKNHTLRLLREGSGLLDDHKKRAKALLAIHQDDLSKAHAQLSKSLSEKLSGVPTLKSTEVRQESVPQKESPVRRAPANMCTPLSNEDVLVASAHGILMLLPLLTRIASDDFSPEERQSLREMTGTSGVFRLSNKLCMLCGERARNESLKTDGGP